MTKELLIVKVGGSLITDKAKPFTLKSEFINHFTREIHAVYEGLPDVHLLLGNGVGSYAHFSAHKYHLREGACNAEQFYGMCVTHSGAQKINAIVTEALIEAGMPAFSVAPSAMMTAAQTTLDSMHIEPLLHLLERRCVPVVHGDTICDNRGGTTIFSTEKVFEACVGALIRHYQKTTVVYMMSAEGVLDARGCTIPVLGYDARVTVHSKYGHDISGGIDGKVHSARLMADLADSVFLVGGYSPGVLTKIARGEYAGTRVLGSAFAQRP